MPTRHKKKRCIPEEGMPHAHKACQKKDEKDSPYLRKEKTKKGRKRGHANEFIHHPPNKKNIHTHAHLDQGL